MTENQTPVSCHKLRNKNSKDLTDGFENVRHLKPIYGVTSSDGLSPVEILNAIHKMQLQGVYGEECAALRIFCTMPGTVAGGERAFSKLKLIKNYLRSPFCKAWLTGLACIEFETRWGGKKMF